MFVNASSLNKGDVYKKFFESYLLASTVNYLLQGDDGEGINRLMESQQDEVIYGKDFNFV